ncbi:hypothetical protein OsJ_16766 [Oryza sativa Japonica Group]|uniref:Uncharacterized protein n=1 Tax=Oryza sativa subsp. japonica TaxID=39947 RepID=B9FJZ8_ORYSJ|nr:hypothetical protein OsJ_16766 [Oryza sativa Japonica Group]
MAEIETISSLADADDVLENRGINQVEGINQVQFRLDEQISLVAATEVKVRTRPGRLGFRLLNPELMDCKFQTKVKLDEAYERMFTECMIECDQELVPLEAHIAELKRLLLLPNNEIEDIGPDIMQRGRGLQQVLYLHPPFPLYPEYEYHPPPQPQIPYQPAYATAKERENARSRDRRAQRAWWHANLTLLETKKKILEGKRIDLERGLSSMISGLGSEAGHAVVRCPLQISAAGEE